MPIPPKAQQALQDPVALGEFLMNMQKTLLSQISYLQNNMSGSSLKRLGSGKRKQRSQGHQHNGKHQELDVDLEQFAADTEESDPNAQ